MPQTNKEISIILSVYNGEKFIEKTLRSILNQRFINFECIIIDDGSTDNTKSIIHDIIEGKKNFTYFFKQNGGYVSARNFGYSKINNETKYIHFMDADDILAPNYYSTLIQQSRSVPHRRRQYLKKAGPRANQTLSAPPESQTESPRAAPPNSGVTYPPCLF